MLAASWLWYWNRHMYLISITLYFAFIVETMKKLSLENIPHLTYSRKTTNQYKLLIISYFKRHTMNIFGCLLLKELPWSFQECQNCAKTAKNVQQHDFYRKQQSESFFGLWEIFKWLWIPHMSGYIKQDSSLGALISRSPERLKVCRICNIPL